MIVLRVKREFKISDISSNQNFSFLNLASIGHYLKKENNSNESVYYIDGGLLAFVLSMLTNQRVNRVSFDFTSIAGVVLDDACIKEYKVSFLGATTDELGYFIDKMKGRYPLIRIGPSSHGYLSSEELHNFIKKVIEENSRNLIVSMGAGLQEDMQILFREQGYQYVSFTCGGFIRQEAGSDREFYPKLINRLRLRAFYRMYKEPHTRKRYIIDYPVNFIKIIYFFYRKRLKLEIVN